MLASEGILSKKHSGVIKLFSQHLVKTGLIEKEFSKILTKARDQREMSDYADFYDAETEEAEEQLQEAERFVERASNFLKNKGYQLDQ